MYINKIGGEFYFTAEKGQPLRYTPFSYACNLDYNALVADLSITKLTLMVLTAWSMLSNTA